MSEFTASEIKNDGKFYFYRIIDPKGNTYSNCQVSMITGKKDLEMQIKKALKRLNSMVPNRAFNNRKPKSKLSDLLAEQGMVVKSE